MANPRFAAALVGTLVKGLGADHVLWGTDSVWYGSPQWQIEAMRRLEIPEDMQKKYGFAALGGADGPVKQMIFGGNAARLYRLNLKAAETPPMPAYSEDRLAQTEKEYEFAARALEPALRLRSRRLIAALPCSRLRRVRPPKSSSFSSLRHLPVHWAGGLRTFLDASRTPQL